MLIKERNHVPIPRGLRQHIDGEWKKIMSRLNFFFPTFPWTPPKDCLTSAASNYACATWKTNCLLSALFPSHIFPTLIFFFLTYIYLHFPLMQQLVYICFSSLSCSLFSSLTPLLHVYTSLFTHHCVPPLIPF